MELVRDFKHLSKNDVTIAGGKGASLGEMTQSGIPVPPGFVILSSSFNQFIEETEIKADIDSILHKVNTEDVNSVETASEEIKAIILSKNIPKNIEKDILSSFKKLDSKFVAVRSSATSEDSSSAAWAGQLESYLNTTTKDLLENVKKCWASLFTPRAIFYRFEKNLHSTEISVAVVVQKMVESEVSGIAFSVHPVTQDYNQLIIEAGLGLGESIVSGQITPDSYVLEKDKLKAIEKTTAEQTKALVKAEQGGNIWIDLGEKGKKQKLTDKQILELSKLIIKIENHYNFPCDIEWAFEKGKFYIVQSRPITTLTEKKQEKEEKHKLSEIDWIKFLDRRRSCFIYYPFIEVEFNLMPKVTGFGYNYHLYKWSGDKGTHYRSASELQRSLDHFLSIVKNNPEKLKKWRDLCIKWDKRGTELTKLFESNKAKSITLKDFKKYYDEFVQVLLYTVTIPYLCMCGIDSALKKGESENNFKKALKILDPLRSFSTYPKLDRSMLTFFWKLLSKETGISDLDLLDKLTPREVIDYTKNKTLPSIEELKKRKNWCIFWNDTEKNEIIFEYDQNSIMKNFPVLNNDDIKIEEGMIKGTVAFPGKVTGIVRRVDNSKDMKKYQKGEIIVSINTNPDLMPALASCSGIITDDGGIMCHAAIVSRELKKPCIIGTKVATSVLKDGDEVELDADNGTIKILNKKEKKPKQLTLTKYMSREHSIFYAHVWNEANRDLFDQTIPGSNVKNMIFLLNKKGVLEVYYELKELDSIFDSVSEGITKDPKKLDNIIENFYIYWNKLLPYIQGKKKVESTKELEEFYHNWVCWWAPMADIFVTPDKENTPKKLRDKALKVREETQEYSDDGDRIFTEFISTKYPKYKDFANLLTPEESFRIDKLSKKEIEAIKERKNGCAILTLDGKSTFVTLEELDKTLSEKKIIRDQLETKETNQLSGLSACPGIVQGKVRLVLTKKDLDKIQKGEIMVTYATSPDYVPAMKLCSGIITDEGGIVCHASIVSRELGIPCVVGTKLATSTLKNGDLVELDANKGIIKILKNETKEQHFKELIHLDFPLIMAELTNEGETIRKLPWTKKDFLFMPYCIFQRKKNFLYYLYDQEGMNWKTEEAGKFNKKEFIRQIDVAYNKLKNTLDKEEALNKPEFLDFVEKLNKTWTWLDCMWWMIEYYDKNNLPMNDLIKIRKKTEKFAPGIAKIIRNSLKKIFPNKKRYIDVISLEEVKSNNLPVDKILEDRLNGFAYTNKKIYSSLEEVEKEFNIKVEKEIELKDTQLQGQTAFPGKVQGVIRLVKNHKDMLNFKKGEILVSSTTIPDFLPAMKKSAAIISEHGGAISHASITSRELKISCIVGVKNATKTLQTGDLVYVDADNGIIRIIKKADKKEEYLLHFRNDGLPFLVVELTFRKEAYGKLDYTVLFKDTLAEGYLSKKGLEQAKKLGLKLMKDDKIYNQIVKFKNKLEKSSFLTWKESKEAIKELAKYYLYCEQPVLAGIEEIFVNGCSDPNSAIKNPEKSNVKGKAKRALEVLNNLGQMKYDLHILSEKPIISAMKLIEKLPNYIYLTEKEIDKLLTGKEVNFDKQRLNGIVISKNKIIYDYESWKQKLYPDKDLKEIRGLSVFPGKASGKVKIFLDVIKGAEIPKGCILVTGMTTPRMLPYMKNASAIVTDEGGITSHAAIISRELHLPCIVGTKIGTQLLKDGDEVEVDADKGIVKILKKI